LLREPIDLGGHIGDIAIGAQSAEPISVQLRLYLRDKIVGMFTSKSKPPQHLAGLRDLSHRFSGVPTMDKSSVHR
jgi:hypothetical protein